VLEDNVSTSSSPPYNPDLTEARLAHEGNALETIMPNNIPLHISKISIFK